MSYTFDGVRIKNIVNDDYWDCRDPHELEELTKHLNTCHAIIRIYDVAIKSDKDNYHKGSMETLLLPKTREQCKIKYEALTDLLDKIKFLKKMEGIL